MVASDTLLELRNIFHSGQVEPSSWLQRIFGNIETGLILKDISFEVKAGEVLAILGSKGSGKRALLDVISRRAHGVTRGQILFRGEARLTLNTFQENCAYVTHRADLIPSLTTQQTLYYAARLSSSDRHYDCESRTRQLLSELALNQVADHSVQSLDVSQYRRLLIGVQLVKQPVILLLDEPTAGLDPLSTYLIISMLSSYARRKGGAVVITMEKPRSDVFPLLERAVFLCLGELLYTGPTRLILDYFTSIGFPCPRMENPLMYYLCLSTVDRRSRERFLESNNQILELVDKFKVEGHAYSSAPTAATTVAATAIGSTGNLHHYTADIGSVPTRPSSFSVFFTLYRRLLASVFNITPFGLCQLVMRLAVFPLFSLFIFLMFFTSQDDEHAAVNRYGIILTSLTTTYLVSIVTTAYTFGVFRTHYYQEAQEDAYTGPVFLLSYLLFSLPFSVISLAASSRIIYQVTGLSANGSAMEWFMFACVLWGCYIVAEHQTIAVMMVVNSYFKAILCSAYIAILVYIVLAAGILRSFGGMGEWAMYLSYGSQGHYASAALSHRLLHGLAQRAQQQCATAATSGAATSALLGCRYHDNAHHFAQRYASPPPPAGELDYNVCLTLVFAAIFVLANCLLYIMPLPAFIKAKFRE